jgi:glutamate/tyrosine decarboxylase-like PLP-dependent enzyme
MSLELSPEQREELGRAALDWALTYFQEQSGLPVYPRTNPGDLTSLLASPLPLDPQDAQAVMSDFEHIAANSRHNGHPRMFGYVQSAGSFAGVAGDLLASVLNQNVTSWRSAPAATTIEHQAIDWLKTMVGFDPAGSGILLSGGSFANFAALATALRASTNVDLHRLGVAALPGKPRVYASAMTHMSIAKGASLLGIGKDAVAAVPVDAAHRMDPVALATQIESDRANGYHAICAVATAGDVNTGAIDPLDAIADVCETNKLWLHVDGSYGALAAQSPHVAGAMSALARVDSLALDPHKWLYAPLDAGCLLVRDQRALRHAFSEGADYIDVVADRDMSDYAYWDHSPELSRRFRALKIWFVLKIHGARAIRRAIDHNIAAAKHLATRIQQSSDFELLAPAPMSIVCFRHRGGAGHVTEQPSAGQDAFNRRLMLEVQRDGDSYLSNAMIGGRFALRACIVNYRTTTEDVEQLLATIRRVAARMTGAV